MNDQNRPAAQHVRGWSGNMADRASRLWECAHAHRYIVVIVVSFFAFRFTDSGWRSYWLDEFLSVYRYGSQMGSIAEVIDTLTVRSVHPPLYQIVLFEWIQVFGSSELATRTLSNVYMSLTTIIIYIISYKIFDYRRALSAAFVFSLTFVTFRYTYESRSYAQTVFLSCLSYLIFYYVSVGIITNQGRRRMLAASLALVVTNTLLLLTHYYNVFVLVPQGMIMAAIYLTRTRSVLDAVRNLALLAAVTLTPLALFFALWWRSIGRFVRPREDGSISGPGKYGLKEGWPDSTPFDILSEYVVAPNVAWAKVWIAIVALFVAGLAYAYYRTRQDRSELLGTSILAAWLFASPIVAWVAFIALNTERYSARYFISMTPPMSILLTAATFAVVGLLFRFARFGGDRRLVEVSQSAAILVVAATFVVPQSYNIVMYDGRYNKEAVRAAATYIGNDPQKKFIIYETNSPVLDFYLRGYGLRSSGEISTRRNSALKKDEQKIKQNDYLLLLFGHFNYKREKAIVDVVAKQYPVDRMFIDRRTSEGFIVFRIPPAQAEEKQGARPQKKKPATRPKAASEKAAAPAQTEPAPAALPQAEENPAAAPQAETAPAAVPQTESAPVAVPQAAENPVAVPQAEEKPVTAPRAEEAAPETKENPSE